MIDRVLMGAAHFLHFCPLLHLFSGFLQDEIPLSAVSRRFEIRAQNPASKFNRARSRGCRSPTIRFGPRYHAPSCRPPPSRIDTELFVRRTRRRSCWGAENQFESETVIAYELGYRAELARRALSRLPSMTTMIFECLQPIRRARTIYYLERVTLENDGAELSLRWQAAEWWRLRGGYTFFKKRISLGGSRDISSGRGGRQ